MNYASLWKRRIALLITMVMVMTMVPWDVVSPYSVFAEEIPVTEQELLLEETPAEPTDPGSSPQEAVPPTEEGESPAPEAEVPAEGEEAPVEEANEPAEEPADMPEETATPAETGEPAPEQEPVEAAVQQFMGYVVSTVRGLRLRGFGDANYTVGKNTVLLAEGDLSADRIKVFFRTEDAEMASATVSARHVKALTEGEAAGIAAENAGAKSHEGFLLPLVDAILTETEAEGAAEAVEPPAGEPVDPVEDPEVVIEDPEVFIVDPEVVLEEPAEAPAEEPEVPAEEPEVSVEEPEVPAEEPEVPAEEPEAPVEEPVERQPEPPSEQPAEDQGKKPAYQPEITIEPDEPETPAEDNSLKSILPTQPEDGGNQIMRIINPGDTNTHTYIFKVGETVHHRQVLKTGETLLEPPQPARIPGMIFEGWYLGENPVTFEVKNFDDTDEFTVKARFREMFYVFYHYKGQIIETQEVAPPTARPTRTASAM